MVAVMRFLPGFWVNDRELRRFWHFEYFDRTGSPTNDQFFSRFCISTNNSLKISSAPQA
jgi:hypothetical protein